MRNMYRDDRIQHLVNFAKNDPKLSLHMGGLYKKKEYLHVLKGNDCKDVLKYNLLEDDDLFQRPQTYAHHLNSSQVLCYNYFRGLIDNTDCIKKTGHPTTKLIELMEKQGIKIPNDATCSFEKSGQDDSYYDFVIEHKDVNVYFEIKYTEQSFSRTGKISDDFRDKVKSYKQKFKDNKILKLNTISFDIEDEESDFIKYYQLYRYALLCNESTYFVCVLPRANKRLRDAFERFRNHVTSNYKSHYIALYWEDIVDPKSKLFEKYFS
jgi:hypothetical protein